VSEKGRNKLRGKIGNDMFHDYKAKKINFNKRSKKKKAEECFFFDETSLLLVKEWHVKMRQK